MYDASLGRFFTQDRFAEDFTEWSPYHYANNNPIIFIDINGDSSIVITGNEANAAFNQLQASVSNELTLSMDANGTLSYTQTSTGALSIGAQQLANAIDDKTITVNLIAENTKYTSTGQEYIGGAFMGNTVTTTATGNTVVANQEVNPQVLGKMSNTNNSPGADMLHEATEAYQGAKISQTSGASSPDGGTAGTVYNQAHNAATPQSGRLQENKYDSNGNRLQLPYTGAVRSEISTSPYLAPYSPFGSGQPKNQVVILTFP